MRIDGAGNFISPHIARAYSVATARAVALPQGASTAPIGAISPASTPNAIAGPTALVAGRVPGAVRFDGVSVPRPDMSVLNMYTRAADKIEAATAVHIGRTIDVKG
jgi:hypothetical protein